MKRAVLLVAHGSRSEHKNNIMEEMSHYVAGELLDIPVFIAYLDFSTKSVLSQLKTIQETGVHSICVVPYFLAQGVHTNVTIPKHIAEFRVNYPEVVIQIAEPLGMDVRIAKVVVDRIRQMDK